MMGLSKVQIKDLDECEEMSNSGDDKDCSGCSCSVCLADEGALLHDASVGKAYQWAYENGIITIDPATLVSKYGEAQNG